MATAKKEPGRLRAKQSFAAEVEGEPVAVHEGDLVSADDPVVKGREVLFVAADVPDHA